LFERRSVRAFTDAPVSDTDRELIIDAAIQAPTAGNQNLYTVLDIRDQSIRDELAVTCDNQPFIARAPLVLIFLADCRRWLEAFRLTDPTTRAPETGDLLLAFADAVIAAQNAVVAAQALGIGSCYIGDILEQRERVRELLQLDQYVMPAAMLVLGHPAVEQRSRPKPTRFHRRYLVCRDRYKPLAPERLREMFAERHARSPDSDKPFDHDRYISAFCARKYESDFAREMNRSVRRYLDQFSS
jgi:nitroreductase